MAKLLLKFQRYFRRKPIRFFTLIALYLTAGSLVFLHAGFSGETRVPGAAPRPSNGAAEGTEAQSLGALPLGRELRAMPESLVLARRYGTWFKNPPKEAAGRSRGDYGETWSRVLKGKSALEKEEERAKYIGCYVDNTHQRALRGVSFFDYKKMTLFRCQDNCAERGYLFAGLEFGAECYCGHKILAENVSDSQCNMECKGEKSSFCGGPNRLSIYRLDLAQESTRRYGSAIFRGCFRRPENLSLALLASRPMKNMSVDRCVDFCTGKVHKPPLFLGTNAGSVEASFGLLEWPEFVKNYAPWWVTHTLDWLKFGKKVLVVHFEDLKQDLFVQLKRMVSLLGTAVHEDRLLCVEGQKDGNFKRSGLRKLEYDPYTPEMKKMINGYIKTVDMALKLRNLTGVPKDYYPR
ncbi:PREDICTED: WSC domain-containing protein 2 [Thamnophis sirtalis]|uniref:WSC domain-containing protein 2 n=1 Tax=Thamnophis sirtalis TaxID=35019 RepID=A0A6I9X2V3_9SAUR|nr:PREDICTED: WSC domain-containing protein 2 [Thamnophis sirtalis]